MFYGASHFQARDISQVNAKTYNDYGATSNAVNVADRAHYFVTSNVEINAGVFTHHEAQVTGPLRDLYARVVPGAMHNSEDRAEAPKCHPETRKAVQENIFSWISHREDHGDPRQLLWLTGPAGTGKSAIMGTISDRLEEQGQLAASFYFASYTGSTANKSKRGFVTTLAYQLQRHPLLKDHISKHVLSVVRDDPAVFETALRGQMEALVLQPLRRASAHLKTSLERPLVVIIDGVDECGEDMYPNPSRSREKDQNDVLSVLLQALRDPAFPCRIVVASRPETWIRRYFDGAAAGHVVEVFLDNSYNPDKDIELFLKSKFAELSRQYHFTPSTWPREEDIQTLVSNASGQFIYPATVIRFIGSHGQPPKKQLGIILNSTPLENGTSPLSALDALYIAVLNSSPSPSDTVLWLKAYRRVCYCLAGEGQAHLLLGLPSLVYTQWTELSDSLMSGLELDVPESSIPDRSWGSTYSFYHRSFLDFLDIPSRSEAAFPDVTDERVAQWVWVRFHRVWRCAGPEVPVDEALLSTFRTCFANILQDELWRTMWTTPMLQQEVIAECNPADWYLGSSALPSSIAARRNFLQAMFVLVHTQCRFYRPCFAGCKRWRKALLKLPKVWLPTDWDSLDILLDRFCIKRVDFGAIYVKVNSYAPEGKVSVQHPQQGSQSDAVLARTRTASDLILSTDVGPQHLVKAQMYLCTNLTVYINRSRCCSALGNDVDESAKGQGARIAAAAGRRHGTP
ncbi:hypothetical protein NMY22_g3443 [Coprinellus aureogranulatus]|nr:hypothetical protein NMY22_g3443 [Coprinellus aureogranulatus]